MWWGRYGPRRRLLCRCTHAATFDIALDSRTYADAIITQSNSCFVSTTPVLAGAILTQYRIHIQPDWLFTLPRSVDVSLIRLMSEREREATACGLYLSGCHTERDNGAARSIINWLVADNESDCDCAGPKIWQHMCTVCVRGWRAIAHAVDYVVIPAVWWLYQATVNGRARRKWRLLYICSCFIRSWNFVAANNLADG